MVKDFKVELKKMLAMVLFAFLLAFLGTFESSQLEFQYRIIYWVGLLLAGTAMSGPIARFSLKKALDWDMGLTKGMIFFSFVFAVPQFFIVSFSELLFSFAGEFTTDNVIALLRQEGLDTFGAYAMWFMQVWLIIAFVCVSLTLLLRKLLKSPHHKKAELPPGHLFLKRLPNSIGHDLVCLEMEDHYVRVYTKEGEHLLLMRLQDAINELGDYDGFQTHRSWWVRAAAIVNAGKEGRKSFLILNNDVKVPVSQSFYDAVKGRNYI